MSFKKSSSSESEGEDDSGIFTKIKEKAADVFDWSRVFFYFVVLHFCIVYFIFCIFASFISRSRRRRPMSLTDLVYFLFCIIALFILFLFFCIINFVFSIFALFILYFCCIINFIRLKRRPSMSSTDLVYFCVCVLHFCICALFILYFCIFASLIL